MSFQGGNKNFNRGNGSFPANNAANGAQGLFQKFFQLGAAHKGRHPLGGGGTMP